MFDSWVSILVVKLFDRFVLSLAIDDAQIRLHALHAPSPIGERRHTWKEMLSIFSASYTFREPVFHSINNSHDISGTSDPSTDRNGVLAFTRV
jgi:hypothetical protein